MAAQRIPKIVTTNFFAKELAGPFKRPFIEGQRLVFLHHRGDKNEVSVFATLEDALRCDPEKQPEPAYELERFLFETLTVDTQI